MLKLEESRMTFENPFPIKPDVCRSHSRQGKFCLNELRKVGTHLYQNAEYYEEKINDIVVREQTWCVARFHKSVSSDF